MPRPKLTVDDLPFEPYVTSAVVCARFSISPNYLGKLRKRPGFPLHKLPGGESRYLLSEVEEWMWAEGAKDAEEKRPAQAARAARARQGIGTSED